MSAIPKPRIELPRPVEVKDPQRLLLHNISWDTYVTIGEALAERPIRLTYDRGNLEIMTTSHEHERYKKIFGLLISVLAEELSVAISGFGSATYQKKDIERGLEPDECYYTTHWAQMRGVHRIDLDRDPPPDLVIEVDVTRSSIDRMGIYASLGVSELWRFDGRELYAYKLAAKREYHQTDRSPTFPAIPLKELVRFLHEGEETDDITLIRTFRAWVRDQLEKSRQTRKPKRKK
jgi:Uma2 family endonuclease